MPKTDNRDTTQHLFQAAVTLARSGHRRAAIDRFRELVSFDPTHEVAWLYLAGLADEVGAAQEALNQVAALNPSNPKLQKARDWIKQRWPDESKPNLVDSIPFLALPHHITRFILLLVVATVILTGSIGGIALFQGAQPSFASATKDQTLDSRGWEELAQLRQTSSQATVEFDQQAMIDILLQMRRLAEANHLSSINKQIAMQLSQLYFYQGISLRNDNNIIEAKIAFDQALRIRPNFRLAQLEARWADLYLSGAIPHQNANWAEAITLFGRLYDENPAYPNVAEILYSAYFNQGLMQQAQGELEAALAAFQKAAIVLPAIPEAEDKIAEIAHQLAPPPPMSAASVEPMLEEATQNAPPQKRVIVDISEQRTYAYAGDELVFDFIVSTGEPGRDTAVGDYEILDKIPMAYASTWNLDMPFWLGIYWVGPLENGFHAVPTQRATGVTMWEGYLGQRVSYGCIVLSLHDAEALYNWVDIGTPVTVRW